MPAPAVLGRDAEVEVVAAFCAGVAEGPATLLVEGEPGMGKTALLEAGVRQGLQGSPSCHAVSLSPTELERGLPFAALLDVCGEADETVLARLPEHQRGALDAALQRVPLPRAPLEQLTVSLAVREVLSAWAVDVPVLLVVDDAQWVDPSSAQVLAFALRRLRAVPVRVVLARRTGRAGEGLEQGPPDAEQTLRLRGLCAPAMQDLLRERCGVELAAPELAHLLDLTRGNPLHALELVRALPAGGRITSAPLAVRPSLTGLLAARLAQLSPSSRELLVHAAAAVRPTVRLLEALGGDLDEALSAGVLGLDAAGEKVAFTHPLLAAAAYGSVPDSRRREVHRRLAALVEDPDQRLQHRALGAAAPDSALADELEEQAALARARGAINAAGDLMEHAERLTPGANGTRRARRRITAAAHPEESGDPARAQRLLTELLPTLPAGPVRAAALSGLAGVVPAIETSLGLLRQAAAEAVDDPDLAARVLMQECMYLANLRGLLPEDLPPLHRAMAAAEARGDRAGWAELAVVVVFQHVVTGLGLDEELVARIDAVYDPWLPPRFLGLACETAGVLVGMALLWTDRVDDADRWLTRERRALREQHRPTALFLTLIRSAELDLRAGRYDVARRHAREAEDLVRPVLQELAICDYVNGFVAAHTGDAALARTRATRARDLAGQAGDTSYQCVSAAVLGFVELSLEEWEDAHRHFDAAMPVVEQMFAAEPTIVPAWADDAEALVALGRLTEAAQLLARLEERGRTLQRSWALAAAARGRGLLLAADGDLDAAERSLRDALQHHADLVDPLGHGRTLLALGAVLRRARRKAAAKQALEQALAVFAGLGATLWHARAERELARIGLRTAAAPGGTLLTEAEERVVELVVSGLTNREVAARLYMSPKTVEAHLSHVYRKLQLKTRTDLARTFRT